MNNKLISFLIPTRKRVSHLKNVINSILSNLNCPDRIEIIFRIDSDDIETINIIPELPYNNLYINGKKTEYDTSITRTKTVDMNFIIGDRGKGYEDIHHFINEMFNASKGKWIIPFGDDMLIESTNWFDEIVSIDSMNKLVIPKLNSWNYIIIPREIPEVLGIWCPNQWAEQWYDEIAKSLNLYVDCDIKFSHSRVMEGETSIDREKFFRELEKSPKWINNAWQGGPPNYDIELRKKHELKLKAYMESNYEFSNKLVNFFESVNSKHTNNKPKMVDNITINFINGPFVEILGDSTNKYRVEFIDLNTNEIIYSSTIPVQNWTKANRQWFTNWKINIYTDKLVFEHIYNAKNKKVYVHLSSKSIGDTLAWFPYVEEFRKKHECEMICSTFHNYLFESKYPNIKFVKPGTTVYDLYAMYEIGIYDGNFDRNKNDHKSVPLQQISADMLGIEFKEIRPNINIKNSDVNKIPEKYIVIATESTAQCKLWNYPDGWQKVVDYLNNKGYKVIVVQKEKTDLKNVIHKVGNKNLEIAIDIINGAEFFVGISSGLSWIAWSLQKKTIMISGFTLPWYEYNENCYRIYNQHSCKGCWHEFEFDKGDWNWCPRKKNFECSSTILPEDVYAQIETIINELDVVYTAKSPNQSINLTNSSIGFKFGDSRFSDAESIFYEIFRNRTYDFRECRINENDVVLDLGANIGIFIRYARACKAKEIYSFEPIKENYDLLLKNNSTTSVIPYNVGVSDSYGVEKFHIDSTTGGHTISEIDINHTRTTKTRQIQCYSLDYMFETAIIPEKIDFMKIDTEGAEIKILQGISDENLLKINKIAMEWHQFLFEDRKPLESILSRFTRLGYKFYIDNIGPHLMTLYFWKP